MRSVVKGFKKGVDVRERCGRIEITAQDEIDAVTLAGLANAMFYGSEKITKRLATVLKAANKEFASQ